MYSRGLLLCSRGRSMYPRGLIPEVYRCILRSLYSRTACRSHPQRQHQKPDLGVLCQGLGQALEGLIQTLHAQFVM